MEPVRDLQVVDLALVANLVGVSEAALIVALCNDDATEVADDGGTQAFESERAAAVGSGGVALVTAARRAPVAIHGEVPLPKELLMLGKQPLIVHVLKSLEKAGVAVAVVLLGHRGREIMECIGRVQFRMEISFEDLGDNWAGTHAQSILRARDTVQEFCEQEDCPCLVVTSDHIFDPRLLDNVLKADFSGENALVVEQREVIQSSFDQHMLPTTLVRVRTKTRKDSHGGDLQRVCTRVGRHIQVYDAVDAGLAVLRGDAVWDELQSLDDVRPKAYFTFAAAMDAVARKDGLAALGTNGLQVFAVETDEQLEFTKVSLRKAGGVDATFHVKLPRKPSSDSLTNLASDSQSLPSTEPAVHPGGYTAIRLHEDADHLDHLEAGATNEGMDALALPAVQAGKAALVRFQRARTSLQSSQAGSSTVAETDTSLVLVIPDRVRTAAESALKEEHDHFSVFSFVTGLDDGPSDLQSVRVVESQERPDGSPSFEVFVERKVPWIGYGLVAVAALSNSTSFIVDTAYAKSTESRPTILIQLLWLSLAALCLALPLALARWFKDRTLGRSFKRGSQLHNSPTTFALASVAALAMFFSKETIQIATAHFMLLETNLTSPEVRVFLPLVPLLIYFGRVLGVVPGLGPIVGGLGFVGLGCCVLGFFLCFTAVGPVWTPKGYDVTLGVVTPFLIALYVVLAAKVRKTVPASFLHAFIQASVAVISILLMSARGERVDLLWRDPLNHEYGLLGFLDPSVDRMGVYFFIALMSTTFGTLAFSISLQYVSPLVIAIAQTLQPTIASVQGALFMGMPLAPNAQYDLGNLALILSAVCIAAESWETTERINADAALRPNADVKEKVRAQEVTHASPRPSSECVSQSRAPRRSPILQRLLNKATEAEMAKLFPSRHDSYI